MSGGDCKLVKLMVCLKKLLHVSCLEHRTSDWVQSKINFLEDPQELPLETAKRWKRAQFGHVTLHNNLIKIILLGALEDEQCCGWQRKW